MSFFLSVGHWNVEMVEKKIVFFRYMEHIFIKNWLFENWIIIRSTQKKKKTKKKKIKKKKKSKIRKWFYDGPSIVDRSGSYSIRSSWSFYATVLFFWLLSACFHIFRMLRWLNVSICELTFKTEWRVNDILVRRLKIEVHFST